MGVGDATDGPPSPTDGDDIGGVMNIIDGGSFDFARAEVATLMQIFDNVQVVIPPDGLPAQGFSNVMLVASRSELPDLGIASEDGQALSPAIRDKGSRTFTDSETVAFWDGADWLRDDYAPVDQLQQ